MESKPLSQDEAANAFERFKEAVAKIAAASKKTPLPRPRRKQPPK
jgi:hypothetical protein